MIYRFFSLLAISLLLVLSTSAQTPDNGPTSIGFPAPDSTQPIRNYQLPSWQWSEWMLKANGQTQYQRRNRDTAGNLDRYDTQFSTTPTYRSFWESEDRRAFLRVSPSVGVQRNSETERGTGVDQNSDKTRYRTNLNAEGTIREYVANQAFLYGKGSTIMSYRRSKSTVEPPGQTQTTLNTNVSISTRIGVGLGRVRVVTPVVRALRVRERLRTVSPGASMSDEDVQRAARQLARRPGYEAVFDRPDKIFWREFFNRFGGADRSPFETFYVAEVLQEPVGVRREGAEVLIGPIGTYSRQLERQEENDQLQDRSFSQWGTLGGFVRGRWYHNITLQHQLGVDMQASYTRHLESVGLNDHTLHLNAVGQWLWVLADRVRLNTRLRADFNYNHFPSGTDGAYVHNNSYIASSDLVIFVENSLSLSAGGQLGYRHRENQSRFFTGLGFNVNYVLSRALQ